MSRREDIDNAIWSDPDFHALTPNAKLVYLWSFTNPRCGMAGLYRVVEGAIALETGLPPEAVTEALTELGEARFVFYAEGVLWVRSRVRHLRSKGLNIAKSIGRDLEGIGDRSLRTAFIDEYRHLGWLGTAFEGCPEGSRRGPGNHGAQANLGNPSEPPSEPLRRVPGKGKGGVKEEEDGPSRAHTRPNPPDPDEIPDDFPSAALGALDRIHSGLVEVAEAHGAHAVGRGRVARLIADQPRLPWLDQLGAFTDWWLYGEGRTRPMRDVVASFRNWVHKRPELARPEWTIPAVANGTAGLAPGDALNLRPLA